MALSRKFDEVFQEFGHGIPVAFLRALSKMESDMNPNDATGPAWGLLQVVEGVRHDYNKRHGTSISRQQLLDPKTNVAIATDLLSRIVAAYNTSGVPELKENWLSPEWVRLLVAGYNSGYSRAAGLQYVARCLRQLGIPVTHDSVFENAKKCTKATKHLSNLAKRNWQRRVVKTYVDELLASKRKLDEGEKKKPTAMTLDPKDLGPWDPTYHSEWNVQSMSDELKEALLKAKGKWPRGTTTSGGLWWIFWLFVLAYKRRK